MDTILEKICCVQMADLLGKGLLQQVGLKFVLVQEGLGQSLFSFIGKAGRKKSKSLEGVWHVELPVPLLYQR